MSATSLLPPITAVRMTWARTGAFSDDEHSRQSTVLVEAALKDIKAAAQGDEADYVRSAIATMDASLRSLDTTYKGRQLNFDENEKLRSTTLASIQESLEFGRKAQDVVKSLPSMTIGAAGGVTIAQALNLSGALTTAIAAGLAAIGYFVNFLIVRNARRRTQELYVRQDYERNLYYEQYVSRVSAILTSLYLDLDRIHKNVFGEPYPVGEGDVAEMIRDLLSGVRPTYCKHVHKHMEEGKVTPQVWPFCETGSLEAVKTCPHWPDR